MGITGSPIRVQNRISGSATSLCSSANKSHQSSFCFIKRGRRIIKQKCNNSNSSQPGDRGLLLNIFPGAKENRRFTANSKSESTELFHQKSPIQNGNAANGYTSCKSRGLAPSIRSKGCIPACSNTHHVPEISKVQGKQPGLPVSGIAVRPFSLAKGVYKDTSTLGSSGQAERHTYLSLSRRYPDKGFVSRTSGNPSTSGHRNIDSGRVYSESQKVPFRAHSGLDFYRGSFSNQHGPGSDTSGKVSIPVRHVENVSVGEYGNSQTVPSPVGYHGIDDSGSPALSPTYETAPVISPCFVENGVQGSRGHDTHQRIISPTPKVVEVPKECVPRSTIDSSQTSGFDNNRCVFHARLGRVHGECNCAGYMGTSDGIQTHQRAGIRSRVTHTEAFPELDSGESSVSTVRQCNDSVVYKQTGWNTLSVPMHGSVSLAEMGNSAQYNSESGVYSRCPELQGRCPESTVCVTTGVATQSSHSSVGIQCSRPPIDRSVCNCGQCPVAHVLHPVSGPSSLLCGQPQNGLDGYVWICVPSNILNTTSITTHREVRCHGDLHHSQVAPQVVVHPDSGHVNRGTTPAAGTSRHAVAEEGPIASSVPRPIAIDGMEIERRRLETEGFPAEVIDTIQKSIRKSSSGQYNRLWKIYGNWCVERQLDPCTAPVRDVLSFLQSLVSKGLAFRTIGVYRSAISKFHDHVHGLPLGQHIKVIKFMRGVFNNNPPCRVLFPTWDINIVLDFLRKPPFVPLNQCGLQALTFKVVFLVAVTSARRCAELQALGRHPPFVRFEREGVRIRTVLGFLPKTANPAHLGADVFLPKFAQKDLCVVSCLQYYLKLTNNIMKKKNMSHNHLFVCYGHQSQGRVVNKRTISGWLVKVIRAAYAAAGKPLSQKVKAHSTRAQATSIANLKGVPFENIMKAADWRQKSTFIRHYGLEVAGSSDGAFGRAVVSSKQ